MLTVEKLKEYGADTQDGLARCMGNEALYLRLVSTVASQTDFVKLKDSVASGDLKSGFEAAHALKGVLGNLSLTPLYDKVSEITELLRVRSETDYTPLLNDIEALRDGLGKLAE